MIAGGLRPARSKFESALLDLIDQLDLLSEPARLHHLQLDSVA
jgi:hypothetical protein